MTNNFHTNCYFIQMSVQRLSLRGCSCCVSTLFPVQLLQRFCLLHFRSLALVNVQNLLQPAIYPDIQGILGQLNLLSPPVVKTFYTVRDFQNGNVTVTKCISCFWLNHELETRICVLACTCLLPLNQSPFVLMSWEVYEIHCNIHPVDYIALYQDDFRMYTMRDRDNVQMPFVQRAGLQ